MIFALENRRQCDAGCQPGALAALNSIRPLGDEKQPVKTPAPLRLRGVQLHVGFLVIKAQVLRKSDAFLQIVPSSFMPLMIAVITEQEK